MGILNEGKEPCHFYDDYEEEISPLHNAEEINLGKFGLSKWQPVLDNIESSILSTYMNSKQTWEKFEVDTIDQLVSKSPSTTFQYILDNHSMITMMDVGCSVGEFVAAMLEAGLSIATSVHPDCPMQNNLKFRSVGLGGKKNTMSIRIPVNQINNNKSAQRKKKPTVMVVAVAPKNNKKKVTGKRLQKLNHFEMATMKPFADSSEGVRLGAYCTQKTVTYKTHGTISLTAPAGFTNCSVYITADPCVVSVVDLTQLATGSTCLATPVNGNAYTANPAIRNLIAISTLPLSSFRVTCVGLLVRNTQPALTNTGRIIFAPIPIVNLSVGPNILQNATLSTTQSSVQSLLGGYTVLTANSSAILTLPGAFEVSTQNLVDNEVQLLFKPNSASSFTFHSGTQGTNYASSTQVGGEVLIIPGNLASTSDTDDSSTIGMGWNGWIIRGEGLPAAASPIIDIEYIYHLEGMPYIPTATTSLIEPTGMKDTPFISGDEVLRFCSKLPLKSIARAGLNMAEFYLRGPQQTNRRLDFR
jgi:hypothetical protein